MLAQGRLSRRCDSPPAWCLRLSVRRLGQLASRALRQQAKRLAREEQKELAAGRHRGL
jgi:hypothetical protein